MKKLILIFIALSFVSVCFAGSIQDMHKLVIARKNVAVAGPDCTDLEICQNHEGVGYDNSEGWTNTTSGGGAVDEDALSSDVSSPAKWFTNALKASVTGAEYAYTYLNNNNWTDSWHRFEFIVTAESFGDYGGLSLFYLLDTGSAEVFYYEFKQEEGANYIFRIRMNDDGGGVNTYTMIGAAALNTKYRVETKYDVTNNVWAWRVNGVDQPNDQDATDPVESEGTLTATHPTNVDDVQYGVQDGTAACTIYIDRVAVDTTTWIGDQ